jgi:hypothetical protein
MRLRSKILLGFAVLVAGCVAWVLRPEPSDRAELTDTCAFPTIDNAQYRAMVAEAKALLAPMRRRIANGDGNLRPGTVNPPLGEVAMEFLKRSRSTEEAYVRLFALGRALDGRIENIAPVRETFAGPWGLWSDRDSSDGKLSKRRFRLSAGFQGPPGLFNYPIAFWLEARLLGRRYEDFRLSVWFDPPYDVPPEDALIGSNVVDAQAFKSYLVFAFFDIRDGHIRLEHRCPDAERFLNHVNGLLKKRK